MDQLEEEAPALMIEDVRAVLNALPIETRAPFLLMLQLGSERSRVLKLRWGGSGWAESKNGISLSGSISLVARRQRSISTVTLVETLLQL